MSLQIAVSVAFQDDEFICFDGCSCQFIENYLNNNWRAVKSLPWQEISAGAAILCEPVESAQFRITHLLHIPLASCTSLLFILLFIKSQYTVFAHLICFAHFTLCFSFFTYIYALVLCYFYIIFFLFFCTVHWADLIWFTFHFWLYPV